MPVTLDRGRPNRWCAYSDLILRLSYTYLKSTDDAQDICQTVFLKVLQKPQAFSSPEHEKAWIIRTAVNLCKDHLKSGWRRATVALDAAEAVPAPAEEEGSLLSAVNLLPQIPHRYLPVLLRGLRRPGSPSFWAKSPTTVSTSSTADASDSAHS